MVARLLSRFAILGILYERIFFWKKSSPVDLRKDFTSKLDNQKAVTKNRVITAIQHLSGTCLTFHNPLGLYQAIDPYVFHILEKWIVSANNSWKTPKLGKICVN